MTPELLAAQVARRFGAFQCVACAEAIRDALQAAGHAGRWIELRTQDGWDYVVCWSYNNGTSAITQTGRHVAIQVGEMVFDNLHPDGFLLDDWIKDFDSPNGVMVTFTDF